MKKQVLIFSVLVSASVTMGFSQRSFVNSQKQRAATPVTGEIRGGSPNGESCANAITAVAGANAADGPATGGGCFNCTDAANADWFVYAAPGAGVVSLSTCLQGADTRVWVYETTVGCAELELVASNDDFCELTSGGDEYASYVEFVVCAGKTYYFEWDDRWEDGPFSFTLAYTAVAGAELAVAPGITLTEYTRMPKSAGVLTVNADYKNNGAVTLTNVSATLAITKNAAPFSTNTEVDAASLATCTGDSYSTLALTQDAGDYVATLTIAGTETEANTANNSISQAYTIDTVFARDGGAALGTFGIGTTGVLGHSFTLPKPDKLTSVSIKLAGEIAVGSTMRIEVYATDGSGIPTGVPLATTVVMNVTDADTVGWITLPLLTGQLSLPAGTFFIGFAEVGDDLTLPVGISDVIYTPDRMWVNIPGTTAGFESIESFGFGGFTFLLRANFGQTYAWASVNEEATVTDVKLMPNPTSGVVTVSFANSASKARITVLDATGKTVKDEVLYNLSSVYHTIDLSAFAQGVYTVRIAAGNDIVNRKVIVAR